MDETFQKPDGEYVPRDRSLEQLASCHDGTNEVWEAVDEAREQSRINDHFNRIAIHEAVHDLTREIVVEAERRTWEEAADLVHAHDPSIGRKTSPAYWGNTLKSAIEAKLSSLTKK